MKIRVRCQRHLVIAHKADDDGQWVFSLCRRGFEEMIGQKLKTGEVTLVEIVGHVVEEKDK